MSKPTLTEIIETLTVWRDDEKCDAIAEWNGEEGKLSATLNASTLSQAIGLLQSIISSSNFNV